MTASEENDKRKPEETREELVERLSRDEPLRGASPRRGRAEESALERVQRQSEIERERYIGRYRSERHGERHRRPNPGL